MAKAGGQEARRLRPVRGRTACHAREGGVGEQQRRGDRASKLRQKRRVQQQLHAMARRLLVACAAKQGGHALHEQHAAALGRCSRCRLGRRSGRDLPHSLGVVLAHVGEHLWEKTREGWA